MDDAVEALVGRVRAVAGDGEMTVLLEHDNAVVVRCGDVVGKVHPATGIAAKLRIAAGAEGILLAPLTDEVTTAADGRSITLWPYGTPVTAETVGRAPWAEAGTLLAQLHRFPIPQDAPVMGGPGRAARAMDRLDGAPCGATDVAGLVRRAWRTLPGWARGVDAQPDPVSLCHGDFHLGQLVCRENRWLLIDIDDLGIGTPAWDLARPAAWFAAGLLHPDDWAVFLDAYRAAGGPAVPAGSDPWPALDIPARTLTVQAAARAVAKRPHPDSPLDHAAQAMVAACARIVDLTEAVR